MKNLKVLNNEKLKDWAQEIFKKNSFRIQPAMSLLCALPLCCMPSFQVNDVDWESPQLVIFANDDPADLVGTKMSSDKIVDVELRAFTAGIHV